MNDNKREIEATIKELKAMGYKRAVPIMIKDYRTNELLITEKQINKYHREIKRRIK